MDGHDVIIEPGNPQGSHDTLKHKPNAINRIGEWCTSNPQFAMWIGIGIMMIGVAWGTFLEEYPEIFKHAWLPFLNATHECLVVLGEAIAALFLIHFVIERKTLLNNEAVMRDSANKIHSRFSASLRSNEALINSSANEIHNRLNDLIANFEKDSKAKIQEIQENLFKGLLQGMDIMPYLIVDHLRGANYSTNFIRTGMRLNYDFGHQVRDGLITIKQKVHFEVENIGQNPEDYTMPLLLSGTSFVSYTLTEAIIKFKRQTHSHHHHREPVFRFHQDDLVESQDKNLHISSKITLYPGEIIEIDQFITSTFNMGSNGAVSDHYHSKIYTIGIEIDVDVPKEYVFTLIPTSSDKNVDRLIVGDVSKYKLPFFLPGQGFYFTIEKAKEEQG